MVFLNKNYSSSKGFKMSYVTSFERLGIEKGRQEERYEMAKNLLAEGLPLELVKKVTKLPDLVLTELEDV